MYAPGIPDHVVLLTAPQLYGFLFNWLLYGVSLTQVYYYYVHFKQDKRFIMWLVYGLFVLETVQTAMMGHDAYKIFGVGWGDPSVIVNPQLEWFDAPLLDGIIGTVVQVFFAYRIYILSQSRILPVIIVLLAIVGGVLAIYSSVLVGASTLHVDDSNLQNGVYRTAVPWLVFAAACDLLICTSMIRWYFKARSSNGFRRSTEDIMTRILRIYVASGTLTASGAIVNVALFIAYRNQANNAYIAPSMVLGKLYTNSMLVLLNQRHRISGGTSGASELYVDTSEIPYAPHFSQDRETGTSASGLSGLRGASKVKVTRTVELAMDTMPTPLGKAHLSPSHDEESVPHDEAANDKPGLLAN